MTAAAADLDRLRSFLLRECGVVIPPHKQYLIDQRLDPVIRDLAMNDLGQLMDAANSNPALRQRIVHQMTTHETSFFRDGHPFETLAARLLPEVGRQVAERKQRGQPRRPFPIWSAACSTGQEPYSVAMLLLEMLDAAPQLGLRPIDIRILATDVSSEVLSTAQSGQFDELSVRRGLDPTRRARFFEAAAKGGVVAKQELRQMISFRSLSLTRPFTTVGPFDLILCRNVLIYFDASARETIIDQFSRCQSSGGVLMLGSSESLPPGNWPYKPVVAGRTRFYRRQ